MAERKGADLEPLNLDFGIEDTDNIDSLEADSFFLDSDPEDVTPIITEGSTSPETSLTSTSTDSKKKSSEKIEEIPQLETDDFLDGADEDGGENKEKENTQETSEETTTDEVEDVNVFQTYSEALLQMGIFSLDEGEQSLEINSPEEFKARWEHERKKDAYDMLDRYIGKFGKKHQDFIVSVLNGVDPEDYFSVYSNIESISNLDISKEDHQKIIYREALKRQGLSTEKIEKKLQRAIELGELEDDAKDFHEILLEKEQERLNGLQAEKAKEIEQKQLEKQHYDTGIRTILVKKLQEKEFDGIPVNDRIASDVFDFLTTEKYQLPDGELLTEFDRYFLELKRPENFEKRVKLALLAQSDLNLEAIKKVAVSKETNHLFSSLKKSTKSKQPTTTQKKTSTPSTPKFKFEFPE